ncbi:MAG: 6-carboxytetrahydropterin synthase [Gemmatimonadales bacterium]
MPTRLTRSLSFAARHQLRVAGWSEAENLARFGTLTDTHGHLYRCGVTVEGPLDPQGMVMDLALLDRILAEEVRGRLDGKHLNQDLPEFGAGTPLPVCEALAGAIFGWVARRLPPGVRLVRVRVAEDDTLEAEHTG